ARALPVTILDDAGVRAVSYGQRVAPAQMTDPHRRPSAWLDAAARLVAVGECGEDGFGRVLRGFPPS
ncbi:MAG: tRNA pseudouridine synthase, partial [Labilithrix sp.]|nr:tRNA pseudouridine synthase [Labilithrix sp.]